MKRKVQALLALAGALLTLSLTAAAGASVKPAAASSSALQTYHSDLVLYAAELKVKESQLATDESRAESRITPCLSKALVPLVEKVDASPTTSRYRSLDLLSAEAGAEYQAASIRPIIEPALNGARRLLKRKLPSAQRAKLNIFVPSYETLQTLNVCADARAWNRTNLAPTREPKGIVRAVKALVAIDKLDKNLAKPDYSGLTPAQVANVKLQKKRSDAHEKALNQQAETALKSWIAKLTRSVEELAGTSTSTTTTPSTTATTTTPTTTTPTTTTTTTTP